MYWLKRFSFFLWYFTNTNFFIQNFYEFCQQCFSPCGSFVFKEIYFDITNQLRKRTWSRTNLVQTIVVCSIIFKKLIVWYCWNSHDHVTISCTKRRFLVQKTHLALFKGQLLQKLPQHYIYIFFEFWKIKFYNVCNVL